MFFVNHHPVFAIMFPLVLACILSLGSGESDHVFAWPSSKVLKVRTVAHRPMTSPNEKLPRRNNDGIFIIQNPVFIDMKLDFSDVVNADPLLIDLCFQLFDLTSQIEIEWTCTPLIEVKHPPTYNYLEEGHLFELKSWLTLSKDVNIKSKVSILNFEVGRIQNLLPTHTDGEVPKWHSTVPYDMELINRVDHCVTSKTELFDVQASKEIENDENVPLFAEKVYHHMDKGFLGAPVRKVLNKRQLHQISSLVSCAQSVSRSDGVAYDGAVAREDFGKFHDAS